MAVDVTQSRMIESLQENLPEAYGEYRLQWSVGFRTMRLDIIQVSLWVRLGSRVPTYFAFEIYTGSVLENAAAPAGLFNQILGMAEQTMVNGGVRQSKFSGDSSSFLSPAAASPDDGPNYVTLPYGRNTKARDLETGVASSYAYEELQRRAQSETVMEGQRAVNARWPAEGGVTEEYRVALNQAMRPPEGRAQIITPTGAVGRYDLEIDSEPLRRVVFEQTKVGWANSYAIAHASLFTWESRQAALVSVVTVYQGYYLQTSSFSIGWNLAEDLMRGGLLREPKPAKAPKQTAPWEDVPRMIEV